MYTSDLTMSQKQEVFSPSIPREWFGKSISIIDDVSTGNIWMLKYDESQKLFLFSKEGELIEVIENIENQEMHDEAGHFYFCNNKGIYSLLPLKQIYKFERQSQDYSKIFVLKEKLFVSFKIDSKNYIKIFTLPNFQPT